VIQVKCHQYYPVGCENEGDDEMVFNDVGLKVTFITERHTNYHFTTRVLQLLDLQVSTGCYELLLNVIVRLDSLPVYLFAHVLLNAVHISMCPFLLLLIETLNITFGTGSHFVI